jgi:hypothetical protein
MLFESQNYRIRPTGYTVISYMWVSRNNLGLPDRQPVGQPCSQSVDLPWVCLGPTVALP